MNRIRRAPRAQALALASLAALVLSGCSNFGTNVGSFTCPATTTVPDLQTIAALPSDVTDAAQADPDRIPSAAKIDLVTSHCAKETGGIESDVTINFTFMRRTLAVRHVDLPYFVALADSTGNILGKREFNLGGDFSGDTDTTATTGKVTMHLPLKNLQLGNVYTIIVGFQLNQAQLDFNRAHLP